jgi:MFS family permease
VEPTTKSSDEATPADPAATPAHPALAPADPAAASADPAAPPTLDYRQPQHLQTPAPPSGGGSWRVGTLTYTTAGLVLVFFLLLLGDLGPSFRDRGAGRSANLLLKNLEANNQQLAFLNTTIPQIIMLIFVPIISFNSDRFRSRWGRRIPFVLLSVPLVSGAMIGVAFCPELGAQLDKLLGASSPGLKSCKLIVYGIFWAIFTFGGVCASTTRPGLTNDVVPRPFLGRFAGTSRALSLICGIIFNFFIFGFIEVNKVFHMGHFRVIYICLAIASGVTLTIMCLTVKEGDYPAPEPVSDDPAHSAGFFGGLIRFFSSTKTYLRECFTNPYYCWVLAAVALTGLAFLPVGSFSDFYAKSMGIDMTIYGRIIGTNHICGFLVAIPIGILADRFHPLRVSIIAMSLYAVTALLGALFIRSTWSFGFAVFGHMFVSGVFFSASGALAMMLLPRIKFAQFFSAATLVTAIATIILTQALGALLDYSRSDYLIYGRLGFVLRHTDSNYRLTYFIGFVFAVLAIIVMLILHRKFMALGGPKGYVAPE